MISYEVYKTLHIAMALLLLGMMGASFFTAQPNKMVKIFTGVSSLFLLVAGMGLLARLGVSHTGGWPGWVKAKLAIWVFIAVSAPIVSKKVANNRSFLFLGYFILATLAGGLAVFKPF